MTIQASKVNVLECTLRDGSYLVDFQFTAEDTAVIAKALENVGIEWIEVGHGLGLNASRAGKGLAAATDIEYMVACRDCLSRAKWGMFLIPGIGTLEDLSIAKEHGMDFVRIGIHAEDVAQARPFLEKARRLGLFTAVNFMKSYSVSPQKLAEAARAGGEYGAQIAYVVDSAGTMMPHETREYVSALVQCLNIPVGFHGHDNLCLGMANVLQSLEGGASWVDTTLQGLGRGGGNPATEVFAALLIRFGAASSISLNRLIDLSDRLIRPTMNRKGLDGLDIVAGLAGFHSGFLPRVLEAAQLHQVDPRTLIVEICKQDQVNADAQLVNEIANRLAALNPSTPPQHAVVDALRLPSIFQRNTVSSTIQDAVSNLCRRLQQSSRKLGRASVLNVVAARSGRQESRVSTFVQDSYGFIVGSVTVSNSNDAYLAVVSAQGKVDYLLVDCDARPFFSDSLVELAMKAAAGTIVLPYRDSDVWVRSVERRILFMDGPSAKVLILGDDFLANKFAHILGDQNVCYQRLASPFIGEEGERLDEGKLKLIQSSNWIVSFAESRSSCKPGANIVEAAPGNCILFDGGVGSFSDEALKVAADRCLMVIRPDMQSELSSEISAAIGARNTARQSCGRTIIAGVSVVAGGVLGRKGEVVVDSILAPSRVMGVADGSGNIECGVDSDNHEGVLKVRRALFESKTL